jgi:hypothetical protein
MNLFLVPLKVSLARRWASSLLMAVTFTVARLPDLYWNSTVNSFGSRVIAVCCRCD